MSEYKITVKTGDIRGAGTDANVFVQLYGDKGNTDVLPLKDSGNTNKFERDNTDEFTFKVSDIGKVRTQQDTSNPASISDFLSLL